MVMIWLRAWLRAQSLFKSLHQHTNKVHGEGYGSRDEPNCLIPSPPLHGLIERALQALAFVGAFREGRSTTNGAAGFHLRRSCGHEADHSNP